MNGNAQAQRKVHALTAVASVCQCWYCRCSHVRTSSVHWLPVQEFKADAVVFATGINGLKKIVAGSKVLSQREEFRRVGNLGSLDVVAGALPRLLLLLEA